MNDLITTINNIISEHGGINNYRDIILLEHVKCKHGKHARIIKQRIYNRRSIKNSYFK